jgi:hypothetical protein
MKDRIDVQDWDKLPTNVSSQCIFRMIYNESRTSNEAQMKHLTGVLKESFFSNHKYHHVASFYDEFRFSTGISYNEQGRKNGSRRERHRSNMQAHGC